MWVFSLQDRYGGYINSARLILCQLVGLQNSPLFLLMEKLDCFAQCSFQEKVLERSMIMLLGFNTTIFLRYPVPVLKVSFTSFSNSP